MSVSKLPAPGRDLCLHSGPLIPPMLHLIHPMLHLIHPILDLIPPMLDPAAVLLHRIHAEA